MKSIKFLLIFALAVSVTVSSCKKDKEEETLPSIGGEMSYDLPLYALTNQVIDLKVIGSPVPNEGIKYKWLCSGIRKDTVKTIDYQITIPDSLATYSVQLTISADNYYSRTITKNVTSIRPGFDGTITGISRPTDSIMDHRDRQWYYTTKVGNLVWFSQNLRWAGAGAGYAKADVMGSVMGRLYTWKDATGGVSASGLGNGPQGVCPPGWSIPTNEDWMDLAKALNNGVELPFVDNWKGLGEKVMVDASFNGNKIWPFSANTTAANKFQWNALAAGSCTNNYNNYSGLFGYAFWWSSTQLSETQANYRYVYYDQPDFPLNYTPKDSFGASVRCVKLNK
ncbi:MAG: FISUMP domain-containing protein [Bacteroidales bacterium]